MAKYLRITFLVAVFLLILSGTVNALNIPKDVWVIDNGETTTYQTTTDNVGDFLRQEGITLGENDRMDASLDDSIIENYITKINITRGVSVRVVIDGVTKVYEKPAGAQAGEIIYSLENENNVKYESSVRKTDILYDDMEIVLQSISTKEIVNTETIPFETIVEEKNDLEKGVVKVVQEGSEGQKEQVIKISLFQGEEKSREIVSEKIVKEPVNKIEHHGTAEPAAAVIAQKSSRANASNEELRSLYAAAESGKEFNYAKEYTMSASAYTAGYESTGKRPGDPGYGITASGMRAEHGVVATDPSVIPLGTKLYIEGYGYAIAGDTGGTINGNSIDLFYESLDDALRFGRRKVKVYVIQE